MDTNRLLQFKTLVETGNMRRAAELLGVSNGGLSRSIRVLEDDLGTKLIVPSGRGIAITEAGKEVYKKILPLLSQLLSQIDELSTSRNQGTALPSLRLATFEVFSTYFLGLLASKYFPGHSLLLRESVPGKLEMAVAEDSADFGITYLPIPRAGVDFVEVAKIEMGIYGHKKAFSDAVEKIPFVIPVTPVEGSPTGVKGLDGWPDHLFSRNVVFQVEMMESALELCRAGLCVGFFPKFVIELHNKSCQESARLRSLPLPEGMKPIRRSVYLVKRSSRPEDGLMRKLAQALRVTCK
jgi:DNA-binding transcriptional LysR family regulator